MVGSPRRGRCRLTAVPIGVPSDDRGVTSSGPEGPVAGRPVLEQIETAAPVEQNSLDHVFARANAGVSLTEVPGRRRRKPLTWACGRSRRGETGGDCLATVLVVAARGTVAVGRRASQVLGVAALAGSASRGRFHHRPGLHRRSPASAGEDRDPGRVVDGGSRRRGSSSGTTSGDRSRHLGAILA